VFLARVTHSDFSQLIISFVCSSGDHRSLVGDNAVVDSAERGEVPTRIRKARVGPDAEVFEGDENALHGEPVSLFRVQREERELPSLQAQPRLVRQVHQAQLHQPVRRAAGCGALRHEGPGLRRRGHRRRRNGVALRLRRLGRLQRGQRSVLQRPTREALGVRQGNAVDAQPNLRVLRLRAFQ